MAEITCYTQPCENVVSFELNDPDDIFAGAFTCAEHSHKSLRTYSHWNGGKVLVRPINPEDLA